MKNEVKGAKMSRWLRRGREEGKGTILGNDSHSVLELRHEIRSEKNHGTESRKVPQEKGSCGDLKKMEA